MGVVSQSTAQALSCEQASKFCEFSLDIILCIADCLLEMGCTHDLAMFSVLHRGVSPAIQGILFRHITLSDFPRCHRLIETLRLGRPTLPLLIRRITAILDTEPRIESRLFLAKHLTDLYTLCPMLSHITLAGGRDGGPGEKLFPDVLDSPRLGTLGTVQSLTLTGPPSNFGPWLLLLLPKLRTLHLFGGTTISWLNSPPPRSGSNLHHVTWGLTSPPTLGPIKWLFASSSRVIGGSLTLVTPPASSLELQQIREYCLSRGRRLCSAPLAGCVPGDLSTSSSSTP
ncbi:hypothetical protein B0J17DRAFT_717291 [Rhizoctonia solani]|nr:hypothetical protein B0J17DRAFT_717291 [Rhizoctonia solani]